MGLFDNIEFKMSCPTCNAILNNFQSKDGYCVMETISFTKVSNFYDYCEVCGTWVEFNRKNATSINDYEMNVRLKGTF